MALYRKYRPATFAEVVGQEHVTEPLSTALDAGRVNHAYLFSGPRGCGKTSSARILARSLNCVEGPTSTPCGVCHSCVALGPGGSGNLDVIELDAASHGGVNDTRELRDRAFYAPAESRYRIFIIDEAHMVTKEGFNALLKIVEEPPEHLIFVFATTEPEKVLPTIRSRTHHYPFRLLAPVTMRGLLTKICAQEQVTVEDAVYPLVIRAGGGSPRDSLSVLDQLLAGAGVEGVTYARALALLGVTDVALIDEAVDALADGDGAALFGTVDKVMDAGHDPRRFAVDLLDRLRDLILMRAVPDAGERGLVDVPGDVLDRVRDEAQRIGPATLARYAGLLHTGLGEMRGATAPRLLLEVICARMLLPAASDADSAVLQRLERLELGGDAVRPHGPASVADRPDDEPAQRFQRPSRRRKTNEGSARVPAQDPARVDAEIAVSEGVDAVRARAETHARVAAAEVEAKALARAATEVAAAATAAAERARLAVAAMAGAGPVQASPTGRGDTVSVDMVSATSMHVAEGTVSVPVTVEAPSEPEAAPIPDDTPVTATSAPDDNVPTRPGGSGSDETGLAAERFVPAPGSDPESDPGGPIDPSAEARSVAEARPEPRLHRASESSNTDPASPDSGEVTARWPEVRDKVRESSKTVEVMLSGATVRAVDNGTVMLAHTSAPLAKRLVEPRNIDVIRQALREVFGVELSVDCQVGAPGRVVPTRPTSARESAKQAGTQRFSRPSRSQVAAPGPGSDLAVDDIPLPDHPDYPDDPGPLPDDVPPPSPDSVTAEDEEEMMAEAAEPVESVGRRDPHDAAVELVVDALGATPLTE